MGFSQAGTRFLRRSGPSLPSHTTFDHARPRIGDRLSELNCVEVEVFVPLDLSYIIIKYCIKSRLFVLCNFVIMLEQYYALSLLLFALLLIK